jgi:predicted carbohydrate-binding protein with CBM5 and CBM33 domain
MTIIKPFKAAVVLLALCGLAGGALAHGLIQSPPSRNWFCGAVTKPDEVTNGVAQFPVCGGAFAFNQIAGYNFMSVLTHTQGRSVVGPRPNVCGFNSETFNGGPTVWDQPIDWPTSNMSSGIQTFTWNISWGPHFSDTQEFRYWITKPGFQFQVGRALSFDDFEDQPFCVLSYNDANPTGNPDVIPDKANALFQTRCNVPVRSGRQVIYAEWGRNQFTFERFHGCFDVVFQNGPVTRAAIARTPNAAEFVGAGTIALDASGSLGTGLTYRWDVSSVNRGLYTLSNTNQATTVLTLANPAASESVTVSLVVTSSTGTDTSSVTLVHRPSVASPWFDLGLLTNAARTLGTGDRVSIRVVSTTGQDAFFPSAPLVLTATDAAASAWPLDLAQAVNALNGSIRIGVLGAQNQITPVADATANRIFAQTSAGVTGAFLQLTQGPPTCRVDYQIVTSWNNGFQANLTITNTSTSIPVVGYTLNWTAATGESFNNGWNATFLPSGQALAASNTAGAWNGVIAPGGGTAAFGFIGNKGASPPVVPTNFRLNGQPCLTGTQSAAVSRPHPATALARLVLTPPIMQGCSGHAPSPPRQIEPGGQVWAIAPRSQERPPTRFVNE